MKRENDKNDLNILLGKHYQKSNALVNSKGRASSIAYKLFALGIQQVKEEEKTGILYAEINGTDLRKIFKKDSGSFYEQIKSAVTPVKDRQSLLDYRVVYVDDSTNTVEAINVVTDCKFENGKLTIRFNNKVNDQIYKLNSNYTVFPLEEYIPLKKVYTLRLYEILKAEYDCQDYIAKKQNAKVEDNPIYVFEINLVDLKLQLGIVDINASEELLKAVKQPNPDYDLIDKLAMDQEDYKKYASFGQFNRTVLKVPQKELLEKTSIAFDYKPITIGRGGKTVGIRFFIRKNVNKDNEESVLEKNKSLSEDDKLEVLFNVKSILGNDYSAKEAREIAEIANYDVAKVKKAYSLMQNSVAEIKSPLAWLKAAIKGEYKEPKTNNSFNNFRQNTYDFEELEKKLLDN